jgi:hypothetical protein
MSNQVSVTDYHPFYLVHVNGVVYDEFCYRSLYPLTWSQRQDIRDGYKEALDNYDGIQRDC